MWSHDEKEQDDCYPYLSLRMVSAFLIFVWLVDDLDTLAVNSVFNRQLMLSACGVYSVQVPCWFTNVFPIAVANGGIDSSCFPLQEILSIERWLVVEFL